MITIIVSSYNALKLSEFSASLSSTIGVPYELITLENPGTMGICEAYNKGAQKAKYDILCFVHDDVKFKTNNWGLNILSYFQEDKNTGVLGIAGSVCKSKMPGSWWQPAVNGIEPKRINIIQKSKFSTRQIHHDYNPLKETKSLVAALDGVLLVTTKENWQHNKFDEKLLKGFHGYDIDFVIRIGKTKNNYVIYDVLIEHDSEGNTDINWFKSVFDVQKKWKHLLPIVKSNCITEKELKEIDRHWFNYLLSLKIPKKDKWRKIFLCLRLLPILGWHNIKLNDFKKYKILLLQ